MLLVALWRRTVGWGDFGLIQGQLEDFTLYRQGLADRAPGRHGSTQVIKPSQRLGEAPTGDPNLCSPMLIQPRGESGHEVSSSRVPAAAVLLNLPIGCAPPTIPNNNRDVEDCEDLHQYTCLGSCRWQKEPLFGPTSPRSSAPSSAPRRNRSVATESENHRLRMTDHRIPEPGPTVHGIPETGDSEFIATGP